MLSQLMLIPDRCSSRISVPVITGWQSAAGCGGLSTVACIVVEDQLFATVLNPLRTGQ
jgi:hypothetical protein